MFTRVLSILLLVFAILTGLLVVHALDRVRRSNMLVAERLESVLEKLDSTAATPVQTQAADASEAVKAGTPPANLAFFDPQAQFGGRMVSAQGADTANLNWILTNEAGCASLNALCNASLAERNYANSAEFQSMLAEKWEISSDHLTYHITLREGVKWQDFTDPVSKRQFRSVPVTANDFKATVDVIRDPKVNAAQLRVYFQDLDTVEVLDDRNFIVRWKRPYYGSLAQTLGLVPFPRHFYDYDGKFDAAQFNVDHRRHSMIVGCGPYRFVRWERDRYVRLEQSSSYFGNRLGIRPPIKNLLFEIIKHSNTRFQALESGQIDRMGLSPDQWVNRTSGKAFTSGAIGKYRYPGASYFYIGYNLKNPLFGDRRTRQALTMLIDRKAILEKIYHNLGSVVAGPFVPGSPYCDKTIQPWPFDPARAKTLLAQAGWRDADGDGILEKDKRKFIFTILQVADHPIQQKMLPMIKESLAAAGIEMKIQQIEWPVYIRKLEQRDYEVCTLGWTVPDDPDPYQVWHSSQASLPGSSNHIGFANAKADKLIEALRVTFNLKERMRIASEFMRIIHEEQPYTFLIAPDALLALSGRYRNVKIFPSGLPESILWTPRAQQLALPGNF
ncbi:MAG: peptide-binding protein [Victivallaceae bacterium]|nr:peptide-binding protein [Victivallaceae bacterium]